MLFNEVYGSYYNAVAKILAAAVREELDGPKLAEYIREKGFSETTLSIPAALKGEDWPFLDEAYHTPLLHVPTMPLTTLQKRWLKALLNDPRISLFDVPAEGLEDVEPLYPADCFVYFDRYADGDPFTEPGYRERFRLLRQALKEKRRVRLNWRSRNGNDVSVHGIPYRLEYSAKDDKFRVILIVSGEIMTANLANIRSVELGEPYNPEKLRLPAPKQSEIVLKITDKRNALERVMLHFSHLEKLTERLDETHYQLKVKYFSEDETEMLIRVLSFGPMVEVIAPPDFRAKIKKRIFRQKAQE